MNPSAKNQPGFLQRSNDLSDRALTCRAFRFLRARLRALAHRAILFADDPRVWRAWANGWEADHYVQLLRWRDQGFCPRVVYDIGAHRGLWSEMCQHVFAPERIIQFEPQAAHHAEIQARQRRAGGQWKLLPVALGDTDEQRAMHLNDQSAASSLLAPNSGAPAEFWGGRETGQAQVTVATLDSLTAIEALPPPDLIKMDVQGYEAKVIAGGQATIGRASRIAIEVSLRPIYTGQALFPDILAALTELNFAVEDANEALRRWPAGGLWQMDLWLTKRAP